MKTKSSPQLNLSQRFLLMFSGSLLECDDVLLFWSLLVLIVIWCLNRVEPNSAYDYMSRNLMTPGQVSVDFLPFILYKRSLYLWHQVRHDMIYMVLLTSSTAWINNLPSSCITLANGGTSEQRGNSSVYRRNTFKYKWLIYTHVHTYKALRCVCVRLQRKNMLTWLFETLEIWVTEPLEVEGGVRKIYKQHLHFACCTDRLIFHRKCSKTSRPVCISVYSCQQCANSPQWNTAFTSTLSDKNRSGFRLKA